MPQALARADLRAGRPVLFLAKRHIAGAWFALRSDLKNALARLPDSVERYVLTCGNGLLARFAAAGLALESGPTGLASPLTDRYRRPYEGTDNQADAMQAYLDWEFGLVEQLVRDGTHGLWVL